MGRSDDLRMQPTGKGAALMRPSRAALSSTTSNDKVAMTDGGQSNGLGGRASERVGRCMGEGFSRRSRENLSPMRTQRGRRKSGPSKERPPRTKTAPAAQREPAPSRRRK
ncbi:hypothetical protein Ddc_18789 [Ditylenchus destructor]|nr:hypothetical protein Ddc_18789 [Ditylenchus destructor]